MCRGLTVLGRVIRAHLRMALATSLALKSAGGETPMPNQYACHRFSGPTYISIIDDDQ